MAKETPKPVVHVEARASAPPDHKSLDVCGQVPPAWNYKILPAPVWVRGILLTSRGAMATANIYQETLEVTGHPEFHQQPATREWSSGFQMFMQTPT